MFSLCDKIRLHRQMISRGSYFATKKNFILRILLFKSRVKWILYSCWKWGDNYYNQHKSEHLENECKIKPRKQLKKKKQESRMNEKWSLQMYRWTQTNFFPVSTVTWAWTTSLSFQHTYSKPSPISKNCEYMPPLNDVFILCSVDMRAGLYDTHLGILACTVKCTERALPHSWGR